MTKNVLLINPWIHDFAAYDFWAKPTGLLAIAAFLRNNGCRVQCIDCLAYEHSFLKDKPKRKEWGQGHFFRETIETPACLSMSGRTYHRYGLSPMIVEETLKTLPFPDVVLVTSMMTYWYPGVQEAISLIRRIFPGVPIILGGVYATILEDHAKKYSGADFVITGEGEAKLASFMNVKLGFSIETIPDYYKLDTYPYPAFDMLPRLDQVSIMTSRGCPYRCSYCASDILSGGFRVRDPVFVVNEIQHWHSQYGVRHFSFYDDAFLVDAEIRAVTMLREIQRRKLTDLSFHCPNGLHAREITTEIAELMFKCNFRTIRLGFETAVSERQRLTGGKITNGEISAAIKRLQEAGYVSQEIGVYILCGLPYQPVEEVEQAIMFIRQQGARPVLAQYSPIPQTMMWEDAVMVSDYDLQNEPLFHNNTLLPCAGDELTVERYRRLKTMSKGNID